MTEAGARARWWAIALFAAAALYFTARGPMRAVDGAVDLPTFYAATRAWALGDDPYDQPTTQRIFDAQGGDGRTVAMCMNPPGFFPLMTPLGLVSYRVAEWLMLGANLAALGIAGWTLGRAAGLLDDTTTRWLFGGAALALAPVHTTFSQGQHGVMVVALLGAAVLAEQRRRDVWVGVLLALAAALKPQMVLLFGAYYLLRGRWRVCAAGAGASALLLAIGAGRLMLADVDWLAALRANLDAFAHGPTFEPDMSGAGNYAILGLDRFIMIDLATLVATVTTDAGVIAAARVAAGAIVVGLALYVTRRSIATPADPLALYALLSVGCLLALYNRVYAAAALMIVVALAFRHLAAKRRGAGWTLLLLAAPFVVPGTAALLALRRGALADAPVTRTWLWEGLLLPHQTLLLVAVFVTLVVTASRTPAGTPGRGSGGSPA